MINLPFSYSSDEIRVQSANLSSIISFIGKGIVLADTEEDAKQKVKASYLKHGYSESELEELQVWKVTDGFFNDSPDVLEVWQ